MPWSDAQTASPLTLSVPAGSNTVRAGPAPRNWMVPITEPFAYCDFTQRMSVAGMSPRRHSSEPLSLEAAAEPAGPN
jgi:hypothetical protein